MSLADRAKLVMPEALQEARRHAPTKAAQAVHFKLKRSDPHVQELLRVVDAAAHEMHSESGLVVVREKIPGAAKAVLEALRRCGVPIDDILRDAGIVQAANPTAAFDVGLNVLAAFGSAFGGRTADAIKVMQERVQAVKEGDA